jgi:transcriptional regulator GlxA family with amidase domain
MAVGAIVDSLQAINEVQDDFQFSHDIYSSPLATESHSPFQAQPLTAIQTSIAADERWPTAVIVVAGAPVPERGHTELIAWLSHWWYATAVQPQPQYLSHSAPVPRFFAGIGTGSFLLGRAGLLQNTRVAIHWPFISLLGNLIEGTSSTTDTRNMGAVVSNQQYEVNNHCISAANAAAVPEMLFTWVARVVDETLATELAEQFGIERALGQPPAQRVPIAARIGGGQPKLTEAVSLMEANIEEPLPAEEIARLVGVSRRQLERLFKQYLNSLPSRYYLELRLTRARHLLQNTSMSILQVGLACGFSSGPHFSSAYRARFSVTPREQRLKRSGRDNPSAEE